MILNEETPTLFQHPEPVQHRAIFYWSTLAPTTGVVGDRFAAGVALTTSHHSLLRCPRLIAVWIDPESTLNFLVRLDGGWPTVSCIQSSPIYQLSSKMKTKEKKFDGIDETAGPSPSALRLLMPRWRDFISLTFHGFANNAQNRNLSPLCTLLGWNIWMTLINTKSNPRPIQRPNGWDFHRMTLGIVNRWQMKTQPRRHFVPG